jgi:hypothetical protein
MCFIPIFNYSYLLRIKGNRVLLGIYTLTKELGNYTYNYKSRSIYLYIDL